MNSKLLQHPWSHILILCMHTFEISCVAQHKYYPSHPLCGASPITVGAFTEWSITNNSVEIIFQMNSESIALLLYGMSNSIYKLGLELLNDVVYHQLHNL